MILKDDFITINVGGLTFTSRNGTAPQYVLNPDAIQGWFDGTSVKRTSVVRPNSWGDFSEPGLMNSRLINITGTAIARTPAELQRMRDAFMTVLNHGGYEEMSVQNSSGVRYATVALEGTPSWLVQIDTVAFWKITLYAPDPRIYGPSNTITIGLTTSTTGGLKYPKKYIINYHTPSTSQLQSIANNGNTKSWPTFRVTGTLPAGFVISDNRNKFVTYTGQVTPYAPVELDMSRGTAIQNGVDNSVLLTSRQWFSIEAGESISPSFEPIVSGSAWCDIIYRDTWI